MKGAAPIAAPACSRPRLRALGGLLLALGLAACAVEDPLPLQPGRVPHPDAVGLPLDAAADAEVADARPLDATLPDAEPPPLANRWRRMAILWPDDPRLGLRAALQPPQRPLPDLDPFATAPDGLWVLWSGPDTPADAWLRALAIRGPVAPLWDLGARAGDPEDPDADDVLAAVAADARWLAARHLGRDRLRLGDRPLLAVRGWRTHPERWSAAREAFAGLPVSPAWVLEVDAEAPPALPAEAAGLFAAEALGPGPPGEVAPDLAAVAAHLAWRDAAAAGALAWFARARPGRNPRLDQPAAAVESPGEEAWRRALLLARREAPARADAPGAVLLDGFGAWRDDHQLDPVEGAATAEPRPLTDGREWPAEGDARRELARSLLAEPTTGPPAVLPIPPLTVLQVAEGTRLDLRLEPAMEPWTLRVAVVRPPDAPAPVWAEVSLWDTAVRLGGSVHLTGTRDSAGLCVDAVFTDGSRWLDAHPEACPGPVGDFTQLLEPPPGVGLAELVLRVLPDLDAPAHLGALQLR